MDTAASKKRHHALAITRAGGSGKAVHLVQLFLITHRRHLLPEYLAVVAVETDHRPLNLAAVGLPGGSQKDPLLPEADGRVTLPLEFRPPRHVAGVPARPARRSAARAPSHQGRETGPIVPRHLPPVALPARPTKPPTSDNATRKGHIVTPQKVDHVSYGAPHRQAPARRL